MVVAATAPSTRPGASQPTSGWDSHVFIVREDDRRRLRERVEALAASLDHEVNLNLQDYAATLAAELRPGGARLTIIATNRDDLVGKFRRAAERLADPRCRQ